MLNCFNRYFERLFDLAGRPLSYRQVEEIVATALGDDFDFKKHHIVSAATDRGLTPSCRILEKLSRTVV